LKEATMTRRRCAILDDYQRVALDCADWGVLRDALDVRSFDTPIGDRESLARTLAPYDIVVAMRERTRFDRALLESLPALRLLVTTAMRNAAIDVAAANERGVVVCGTGSHPGPAAELTWSLILAAMRRLPQEFEAFRSGRWQTTIGRSLHGATLGILGVGKIGAQMASVARTFGMRVVAWSRSLDDTRAASLSVERADSVDSVLAASDVVTIHLPLTNDTRGLVGARELALMKRDAWLVNTARGPIVDEDALVEALTQGRIAGAALDVYDVEPLPAAHPFRRLPNVVATSHVGYVTHENYRRFYGDAVEDIVAWLAGKPVRVLTP
jgi:phosphoglycerate dehydrogenase-like enzyme